MRFFWISVAYRFAPVFEKGLLMAGKGGCGAAVRGVWGSGQRSTRVVELAGPHAVQEALPLVPVVDEHPVVWVAGHAHQHPLRAGSQVLVDERDLEGAIAVAGPLPVLCDQINAEFRNGRLGIRRFSSLGYRRSRTAGDTTVDSTRPLSISGLDVLGAPKARICHHH